MKKYLLVAFCALLLFVVTGCGNKNQVVCSETQTEDGVTIKGSVIVDFDKENKLTDATAVYELDNKETATQYCNIMKIFENADKGIKVDCSGSKITIKGFANVEDEEDQEKLLGMTKEEFLEKMETEKYTCK